jgi:hypothetical protein
MNLFAIVWSPGTRVLRLPLSNPVQTEVAEQFKQQEISFMDGIDDEHEFDGRYRPDEGELLKISNFDDIDGMGQAVLNPLQVEQYDPNQHSLDQVKGLFSGYAEDGETTVLIQLFERRRMLARSGLTLFFSNNTFQKMEQAGLSLDTKLLAILKGPTLKFQSFHFLRRVFDVDDLFQQASDQDLQTFVQLPAVAIADQQALLDQADSVVRRKIGFILQSGVLTNYSPAEIQAAAAEFGIHLPFDAEQHLVLPHDRASLKKVLRFLDEDYFESPISKTKFVSNSKRVAD